MSSETVKMRVTHICRDGTFCLEELTCKKVTRNNGNYWIKKNTYSDVRLTGIGAEPVEVGDVIELRQKTIWVFEFIQKIHEEPRTENRLGTWQTGNRVKIRGFEDTFPLGTGDEKQRTHGEPVVVRVKIDGNKVLSCEVVFFVNDRPLQVKSRFATTITKNRRPGR